MVKKKEKLVTVIVLTYNKFKNIEENIKSILIQDYNEIEVVISDDASKNFNREKIESFFLNKGNNIKNIKIIQNKNNLGTVKNFNNAIKLSNGEYIIPLSEDDIFYDKNVISDIVKNFANKNILTGIREMYSENNNLLEIKPKRIEIEKFKKGNAYRYLIHNGNIISGASTYYRKDFLEKNGYFDERFRLLEDFPFYLKVIRNGEEIFFLDRKVIKYQLGGVSSSDNGVNPILKRDISLMYEIEKDKNKGYDKRYLEFMERLVKETNNIQSRVILYIKYLDIFIIKLLSKIFKKNLFILFSEIIKGE